MNYTPYGMSADERKPLHAQIRRSSMERLTEALDRIGISKYEAFSRLAEWFATLDLTEQCIVMGIIEARDVSLVAEIVLRRKHEDAAIDETAADAVADLASGGRSRKSGGRALAGETAPQERAQSRRMK